MEDFGTAFDMPSPASTLYYAYGDAEHYSSGSQSPSNSTYDMASTTDLSNFPSVYPSPEHHEEDSTQPEEQDQKPAAKRKRENRYKNAPPSVLSRRRAQNRASQRAYRERKDQRIKDLEKMLSEAQQQNDALSQQYAVLHSEYVQLKNSQFKDQSYQHHHLQQPDLTTYSNPHGGIHGLSTAPNSLDMELYVYPDMSVGYGTL
ncbi:hypothetical protein QBC35DRAFT_290323 [Podospora australis]|uniref:Putative transcription factor kapC n=1 Tax=Podospora australis TaxID=1536484 RepID=A0AAN6X1I7_9PEZI|nr:hypothetical protein QBC35DRAFT_290323 [Podospora australis]